MPEEKLDLIQLTAGEMTQTCAGAPQIMAARVVVKNGANTYEFTYSDYKDWNNPLNPAEALIPGRMIEKKNGTVVRDITTTLTETGQMYVVMCSTKRRR